MRGAGFAGGAAQPTARKIASCPTRCVVKSAGTSETRNRTATSTWRKRKVNEPVRAGGVGRGGVDDGATSNGESSYPASGRGPRHIGPAGGRGLDRDLRAAGGRASVGPRAF